MTGTKLNSPEAVFVLPRV